MQIMSDKNQNKNQNDYKSILIRSVTASVIGIVLSLIILSILAVILYFKPINEDVLSIIAMISEYVCVIVVAFTSCINKRHSGYLRGAVSACVFIFMGGLLYYSVYIESFCFRNLLYDFLIAGILGIITGAFAVNLNSKSHSR